MAAPWLQMNALAWLLEQVRSILLILLVILFQPELRRLLLALGQSQFLRWFYKVEPSRVIDEVVNGVVQVAEQGYGALIVLGRQSPLGSVVETGVAIDSEVSDDLLTTIFNPRTPLHDQAVVIQGERLIAAPLHAATGRGGGRSASGNSAPRRAGVSPRIGRRNDRRI